MNEEFYYIYCKGILGVKTNEADFRWTYGSSVPQSSYDEYEACAVKLDLCVKPEKELRIGCIDQRFQSYTWDSRTKTIHYRRKFFRYLKIGFNIRIDGNTIYAEIGRNYYRFVHNRVMNLHGIYYLLADLANVLLLKNGFLSLYAAAVYSIEYNRCIILFAPPNTGKTLTAGKLCGSSGCQIVGEDVLITDTRQAYACPWTLSSRKSSAMSDDSGAFGRSGKAVDADICEVCEVTDLAVLSLGRCVEDIGKSDFLQRISILSGYLFGYYSTPIVKILAYFDVEYRINWNARAFDILEQMINHCNCRLICAETPIEFYKLTDFKNNGTEA